MIRIQNTTKKTTISASCEERRSAFGKTIGLMFACHARPVMFTFGGKPRIVSLHMFFVFFPIDVIWVDETGKVVELLEDFSPFHVYAPSAPATRVIELPCRTIASTKTEKGDTLSFTDADDA